MARFLNGDSDLLNMNELVKRLGVGGTWMFWQNRTRGQYIKAILNSWSIFEKYEITTPLRVAHFIGQGIVETGSFNYRTESLKYSEQALINTFSVYRNNPELARKHAKNEYEIGRVAYGGRMGNDDKGDGFKYRGRGFIQLTGRNNYTAFADVIEEAGAGDLVEDPDIIARDLSMSVLVGAAFWARNNLNQYADDNNAAAVSRGVNRGNPGSSRRANHESERINWTNAAIALVKAPEAVRLDPDAPLKEGAKGERVIKLQEDLLFLGYDMVGSADGDFGRKTLRALLAYQHDAGLPVTGVADAATFAAIKEDIEDPLNRSMEEPVSI